MDQKISNISNNPNSILINNPVDFFIKEKQEHFWNIRKKDTEHEFRILLKQIILREEEGCEQIRWNTFYRQDIGYGFWGVGFHLVFVHMKRQNSINLLNNSLMITISVLLKLEITHIPNLRNVIMILTI